VTADQIQEALDEQRASGREIGEIVVERGWVSRDQLTRVLAYVPVAQTTPRAVAPAPPVAPPPAVALPAPAAPPAAVAPVEELRVATPAPVAPAPVAPAPAPAAPAVPVPTVSGRVFVRLTGGDRLEIAKLDDLSAAKARAAEVVGEIVRANGSWPFIAGRYIRPDAVVSVDVEAAAE
jgi:hypothetical protein